MPARNTTAKPARKATTRTTRSRQEKVAAFDAFRARAAAASITTYAPEPFTVGPEYGFNPPLVAKWPTKLTDKVMLDTAADRGQTGDVLRILLGPAQLLRAAQAFEPFPDGDQLLAGLCMHIWEGMLGAGAGDVPGGTAAS